MARTIDPAVSYGFDRPAATDDPKGRIVADYRATMGQMKCALSERLVRLGISMAQLHIMYTLQRTGEMPMSRLADVLNVSLSNATGLVDRMEERGFIERTRVPSDRRVVLVRVTDAGTRMIEANDALSDELLRDVLTRLDPVQLPIVAHAMAEFRAAVEATTGGPPPDLQPASTLAPRSR
ncbi:MAG: MarR family transcriptional regulator [Candidatus Limnocylindrales bacterium]